MIGLISFSSLTLSNRVPMLSLADIFPPQEQIPALSLRSVEWHVPFPISIFSGLYDD